MPEIGGWVGVRRLITIPKIRGHGGLYWLHKNENFHVFKCHALIKLLGEACGMQLAINFKIKNSFASMRLFSYYFFDMSVLFTWIHMASLNIFSLDFPNLGCLAINPRRHVTQKLSSFRGTRLHKRSPRSIHTQKELH